MKIQKKKNTALPFSVCVGFLFNANIRGPPQKLFYSFNAK
jgi:hypothetical protein